MGGGGEVGGGGRGGRRGLGFGQRWKEVIIEGRWSLSGYSCIVINPWKLPAGHIGHQRGIYTTKHHEL